jgi:activator of HSP90 ATPase
VNTFVSKNAFAPSEFSDTTPSLIEITILSRTQEILQKANDLRNQVHISDVTGIANAQLNSNSSRQQKY